MENTIPLPGPSSLPTLDETIISNPPTETLISKPLTEPVIPEEITNDALMPLNFEEVLINHEQRLQNLEAILLRIRGSI